MHDLNRNIDEITARVAQLWCLPQHEHKVMDPDMAQSMIELCRELVDRANDKSQKTIRKAYKQAAQRYLRSRRDSK